MDVPKTVIIGINMHGEIPLKENGYVMEGTVPEKMTITIINAVVPGVPNISTLENYENLTETVSKNISSSENNWDSMSLSQIEELSEKIKSELIKENESQSKEIIKQHKRLNSKKTTDVNFQRYAHSYDNAFKITTYNENDSIPDKLYYKFGDGEVLNPENITEQYFNQIVIYNLKGEPDIFDLLESVGMEIDEITTIQLIEFLQSLGVENLIIIDLSCSTFKSGEFSISDRRIRYMRRTLAKGINKKTKRKGNNKQQKSRRHKKSRKPKKTSLK
jgi:hypothetical protein